MLNLLHDIAELVSMAGTFPLIGLAWLLVMLTWREAKSGMAEGAKSPADWLIMGICVGWLGESFDNIYWAFPWTCSFLRLEATDLLMWNGVFANIPCRQGLGIIAGYCHVRGIAEQAESMTHKNKIVRMMHRVLLHCSLVGVSYSAALIVVRHWLNH